MTLAEFFAGHPRAALALSGGVDSAYLLAEARAAGCRIRAYFVQSAFQPRFELLDALALCKKLAVPLTVVPVDILADGQVAAGGPKRCYFCKRRLFAAILEAARRDGFSLVLDGTNASDDAGDRPGMAALQEAGVLSPLRLCGLTKADVRRGARAAGLAVADKPAYACLATRVATGEPLTAATLRAVERGEGLLFSLGFSDFRLRCRGGAARLEIREADFPRLIEARAAILAGLKADFSPVTVDLEVRG